MRAKQVMDELIQRVSLYKYDYTGRNPPAHQHENDRGNIDSYMSKRASEKRTIELYT